MPRYDFRCRQCGETFEVNRPMAQAGDPATCPQGHPDTVKLLSVVAVGGLASMPRTPCGAPSPDAVGCCGGACSSH